MFGMSRQMTEDFLSEDPWNCIEYMLNNRPECIEEYLESLDDRTQEVTAFKESMGVS